MRSCVFRGWSPKLFFSRGAELFRIPAAVLGSAKCGVERCTLSVDILECLVEFSRQGVEMS